MFLTNQVLGGIADFQSEQFIYNKGKGKGKNGSTMGPGNYGILPAEVLIK